MQGTAGRGMQGQKLIQSWLFQEDHETPREFCWGPSPHRQEAAAAAPGGSVFPFSTWLSTLPGVQGSAGIKLLQPDTLQTHQSPSAKDHYFLSCLSLKAAFISLSPFCQTVSVSSFKKYHLRCLQPKGKQEKHFSLLLSNQCVASSSLPGAPLL